MDGFTDVFALLFIACLVGMGIGFAVYSIRLLRRGGEVTAEDAVNWRRSIKKLGFDASPDMNPDITDTLVRAWRSARGWSIIGNSAGALLAGACAVIFLAVRGGVHGSHDLSLIIGLVALMLLLFPCGAVGLVVGMAQVKRESRNPGTVIRRRLRDFRSLYVALYPLAVLIVDLILVAMLVVRLAPRLDSESLKHAFSLPGMWIALAGPAVFLFALILVECVTRWIVALPSLGVPQDAEVKQQADHYLRRWAVWRLYAPYWSFTFVALQAQLFTLDMNVNAQNPLLGVTPSLLIRTDMDYWFLGFLMLIILVGLPLGASTTPSKWNTRLAARRNGSDLNRQLTAAE